MYGDVELVNEKTRENYQKIVTKQVFNSQLKENKNKNSKPKNKIVMETDPY